MGKARTVAFCGIAAALSLLFLCLAGVLPNFRIACYFFSSLFIYIPAREAGSQYGLMAFAACAVLGFLLLPNKVSLLPYAGLLGHYATFNHALRRVTARWVKALLALAYCDIFLLFSLLFYRFVLNLSIFELFSGVPGWLLILAAQLAIVAFIALFWYSKNIYETRLRHLLKL